MKPAARPMSAPPGTPRFAMLEGTHKPHRPQPVAQVVEEGAAAGLEVERPAEAVLDEPGPMAVFGDLPQLLDAEAEFLRVPAGVQAEPLDQALGQASPRPLGEERIFAAKLGPASEAVASLAILSDPHVAGGDAQDFALVAVEDLRRGEAGIALDAKRLSLPSEPAADVTERNDEVAVVAHQRRHQDVRQAHGAASGQPVEPIVEDGLLERIFIISPSWQQGVDADRIDHRPRQDGGADLRPLLP